MKIPPDVMANWNGRTVLFLPDENGVFAKIKIIATVADPSKCSSRYEEQQIPGTSRQVWNTYVEGISDLEKELTEDLKVLESSLASQCLVARVRWYSAKGEFIPETDQEAKQIQVNHFQVSPGADRPEQIEEFDPNKLAAAIHIASQCRDLVGALSFFREGLNSLRAFRNIQAFFNFYFVLEGLYSGGKYKEAKNRFGKSKVLTSAIQYAVSKGLPRPFRDDNQDIESMLKNVHEKADVEGIIHLLVSSRGDLHHFLKPAKHTGTPLTDDQYECLAKLTAEITMTALSEELRQRHPKTKNSI